MTHVVVVARKVTSIFILHLPLSVIKINMQLILEMNTAVESLHLDTNDVSPVDVEPRLQFGKENSKPVADCLHVIWSRREAISCILRNKDNKDGW